MSNLLNSFYSNLNDLISLNATDINSDNVTTNQLTTNSLNSNNIYLTGAINNGSNYIYFNEEYQFIDIPNNFHIYGTLFLNYNGVVYNVGDILSAFVGSGNISPYPSITYNNNITTFTGGLVFPSNSIASASINNSDFVSFSLNENITGQKNFSGTQVFSSIQLGSSLILNGGNLTLSNSQLQKILFLENITTDLNSKFNNYVLTTALTTTLNNYVLTTALTTTLNNYVLTTALSNYITSTSLTTTLNNYVLTTALNTKLNDYVSNSSLTIQLSNYVLTTALSNYITSTSLTTTLNNYVLTTTLNNYVTSTNLTNQLTAYITLTDLANQLVSYALTSALNTTNSNVTSLQNKLQSISYDVPTEYFDMNKNAHIYGVLKLGNILDVETTINGIGTLLGTTSAAAIKATTDIYTINTITLPAMNLVSAGLSLRIDNLETKTTNVSFNLGLNTTYIAGTTSMTTMRVNSLDSGIIQTANQSVVFIGETEIRNDFRVKNGFGASIDGGIVQNNNSANTFTGSLTINNNFTSGGTNTNINSTNCNITGNTIIKNTSTTSSGTISPYVSVLSISTNTNAKKLQGIVIGKEQVLNNQSNCNIGYNYVSDGNAGNYGYLGLNVNTLNTIESLRWFDGGCAIPVGNLTISSGNLSLTTGNLNITGGALNTNTINNVSSNTLSLNSSIVNIGTNQGALAINSINIGSTLSASIINLNGVVNTPYGITMTGGTSIFSQWV